MELDSLVSLTRGGSFIRAAACKTLRMSRPCPEFIPLDFFFWWYIDDVLSCSYSCINLTIQTNTEEYTVILLKHYLIDTIYYSDMYLYSICHPQRVRLIHFSSKVNRIRIWHLVIHVIDLAVEIYQSYWLMTTLLGLKHVGVIYIELIKWYVINICVYSSVFDSVEIPTRCSFVIEFIIPKYIEGSTCFERHTAHHQEL